MRRRRNMVALTETDKAQVENLLTEILTLALMAAPHIRPLITDIAIGVADLLPEEAVERSKDYAQYRAKEMSEIW
jgi:hypothetical protein